MKGHKVDMKILIAGKIPEIGLDILGDYDVEVYEKEELITEDELCERIKDKDALLSLLSTSVSEKVIDAASNLKIISNFGAGFNNIDVISAIKRNIAVTNTPVVSTDATAELTFGLVLAVARRIAEGDKLCKEVGFKGWAPLFFLGDEIKGKTLGIIGFGNIGRAVAKRAAGFEMNILYTQRNRVTEEMEQELHATYVSQEELIASSDFIVLNCSYTESMKHMIGEHEFNEMKKSAYIINAARGPLVDEKALVHALKQGDIKGAALDVYEFEPEISEELKEMNNVVLTPHIGNATIETRNEMAKLAANNIVYVLNGNKALTPVG